MAATAVVARRVGEQDIKGANQAAVQVIILGVAVSIIVSIIGIFYAKDILRLMGGEPDLIAEGFLPIKVCSIFDKRVPNKSLKKSSNSPLPTKYAVSIIPALLQ